MSKFRLIVGLALAFGGFEATDRLRNVLNLPNEGLWPHIWKWVATLSLLGFVRYVEDESPASVGWHSCSLRRFMVETTVSLTVLLGANIVTEPFWDRIGEGNKGLEEGISSYATFSIPELLFIALTAGVTEEFMYRGYAMERLTKLTGSSLFAGTVSASAFMLAHLGDIWDESATLRIAQPTVILTVLYPRVRTVSTLITAHALNDAVGLLLADRYTDEEE